MYHEELILRPRVYGLWRRVFEAVLIGVALALACVEARAITIEICTDNPGGACNPTSDVNVSGSVAGSKITTPNGVQYAVPVQPTYCWTLAGWVDCNTPPATTAATSNPTAPAQNWYCSDASPGTPSGTRCSWPAAQYREAAQDALQRWCAATGRSGCNARNCTENTTSGGVVYGTWTGSPTCSSTGASTQYGSCPGGQQWRYPPECVGAFTAPAGYFADASTPGTGRLYDSGSVQKPQDGKCSIKRSGNTFSGDPLDPDCAVQPGVTVGSSSVTASQTTGAVTETVQQTVNSGNGTQQVTQSSGDSAQNKTTTTVINIGAPSGGTGPGTVTGKSTTTSTGVGDATGGTTKTDVQNFPDDYTREGTQQQVKGILQDIKDNGLGFDEKAAESETARTDAGTSGEALNSAMQGQVDAFNAAAGSGDAGLAGISGLSQFVAPGSADSANGLESVLPDGGSCVPASFSWLGQSVEMDYCGIANYVRSILNWMLAALTGLYIWARFYRRES
jgi:hypothetical protein